MLTLCSRPFEGRGQGRRAAVPQATELLGLPPGCASVVRRTQITSPAGTSFSPFPPRGNSRVLAFFILTLLSSPFFSSHSDSAGHNAGGAEGHAGLGPACSFPRLCLAPRRSPSRQLPPRGPPARQRSGRLRTGRLWGSSQGPRAAGRVALVFSGEEERHLLGRAGSGTQERAEVVFARGLRAALAARALPGGRV